MVDTINEAWMSENVSVIFLAWQSCFHIFQFIFLPIGNANEEETPKELQLKIKIHFPQGPSYLCLLKSLASTLMYMKLDDYVGDINQVAKKYEFMGFKTQYKKIQELM